MRECRNIIANPLSSTRVHGPEIKVGERAAMLSGPLIPVNGLL